jgi:hypothetical protein
MLVASYSEPRPTGTDARSAGPPEVDDLLATTTQAAMDGGETVKRLLLFARATPDQDTRPVDLTSLVRDAEQLTTPRRRDGAQGAGCRLPAESFPGRFLDLLAADMTPV